MYFSPLQDPRRAWAATLKHSTSLDRDEAGAFDTLDVLARHLIRRRALRTQQSPPRRQLAPQGSDMAWAPPEGSQGRRPRPTSRSATPGDKEDRLFSPRPGGEETTCRNPTCVTPPSLIYKRRRRVPYMGIGSQQLHSRSSTRALASLAHYGTCELHSLFHPSLYPLLQALRCK